MPHPEPPGPGPRGDDPAGPGPGAPERRDPERRHPERPDPGQADPRPRRPGPRDPGPGAGAADRFIAAAELTAGLCLALVASLTFASVGLRYLFAASIPDAYDLGRNLMGVLIFWGIAATGFRGEHITVDLLWGVLPGRGQRVLDLTATMFSLVCMAALAWAMGRKALDGLASGETTYDLAIPLWPFQAMAWLGTLAAVALLLVRLARGIAQPGPFATERPGA